MAVEPGVTIGSLSAALPPPTGGWNARDPLDRMADTDAVVLDNIFPQPAELVLRNGFSSHATGMTSNVETLAEYSAQDGTRDLMAAANNNIYDATAAGAASSVGSGFTNNKWQTINFKNLLWFANGADTVKTWNGTTLANSGYTGVTLSTLIDITVFKERIYFVQVDTASVWYSAVDSTSGSLTEFDVSSLLARGGFIQWASSWTRDSGSGSQDLFVICSNMGEILVYEGADPGDSSWQLFGRFFLPIPLGRRSKINFGSDLLVITEQGVIPLSKVLAGGEEISFQVNQITDKIQDKFREIAGLKKSNFGWEGQLYPAGSYLLINIPVSEDTTSEQYVMNTLTGAWCRFTGQNAFSWSLLNEELYFGGASGVVYKADTGSKDGSASIDAKLKTAFNFFGDRLLEKRFTLARPLIRTDNDISFSFGIDVDFEDTLTTAVASTEGSLGADWGDDWDTSDWSSGLAFFKEWRSVEGLGRSGSLKFEGMFEDVNFRIAGFNLVYEPGGIL